MNNNPITPTLPQPAPASDTPPLPADVVDDIMRRLPLDDYLVATQVCQQWRDIARGSRDEFAQALSVGLPRQLAGHDRRDAITRAMNGHAGLVAGKCHQTIVYRSAIASVEEMAQVHALHDSCGDNIAWDISGRYVAFFVVDPTTYRGRKTSYVYNALSGALKTSFSQHPGTLIKFGERLDHVGALISRAHADGGGPPDHHLRLLHLWNDSNSHLFGPDALTPLVSQTPVMGRHLLMQDTEGKLSLAWRGEGSRANTPIDVPPIAHPFANFSPSGEHLALYDIGSQSAPCRLIATRTGKQVAAISDPTFLLPTWEHTGASVGIICRTHELAVANLRDGRLDKRTHPRGVDYETARLSYGGKHAIFWGIDNGADIVPLRSDDRRRRCMAEPGGDAGFRLDNWVWSPDGRYMAGFVKTFGGRRKQIRITELPANAVVMDLAVDAHALWLFSWSPDSTKLAVAPSAGRDGGINLPNLRVFEVANGTTLVTVPDFSCDPPIRLRTYTELKWSPDGARLAYRFSYGSFGLVSFDHEFR